MTYVPPTGVVGRARRAVARLPDDLVAVGLALVVANAVVLGPDTLPEPLTFVVGMVVLFVLPGYALVAALFPVREAAATTTAPSAGEFRRRLALSFGASVGLVPLYTVFLGFLDRPFTTTTVAATVSIVVLSFGTVAVVRRRLVPPHRRYEPPSVRTSLRRVRVGMTAGDRRDVLLNVALVVAVLVAGATLVYGLAADRPATPYTSASLLTTDANGDLVASGYPTDFTAGEPRPLTLRIENQRPVATEYTVVVATQRVRVTGGTDLTVVEHQRLDTMSATVGPGETWTQRHQVAPTMVGDRLRLAYFVYHGDAPARADRASAAEFLQLWITVGE